MKTIGVLFLLLSFDFYAQNLDSLYDPVNVPREYLIDGLILPCFECDYDTSIVVHEKTKFVIQDSFPAEYVFADSEKSILHLRNCTLNCRCSDCQSSVNLFIEISDLTKVTSFYFNETNAYLVNWNSWVMPRFDFVFDGEVKLVNNKYHIKLNQYYDFDRLRKMPITSSFVVNL